MRSSRRSEDPGQFFPSLVDICRGHADTIHRFEYTERERKKERVKEKEGRCARSKADSYL